MRMPETPRERRLHLTADAMPDEPLDPSLARVAQRLRVEVPVRRNTLLRIVPESVPSFRSAPSAVRSSKMLSSISTRSVLSPSDSFSISSVHSYLSQFELAEPT